MQKLEKTVNKNGFTYNQIVRSKEMALYEQIDKQGILAGHEIFKIGTMPAGDVFGTMMPEREVFPKNESFGVTAWSVGTDANIAVEKYVKKKKELGLK